MMAKRNTNATIRTISSSFLTPRDSDPPLITTNTTTTRPSLPMLPSLPDDFDLFDTTTRSTTVTLAPRFSFHHKTTAMMMNAPKILPRQEEENVNKENGNHFSAELIASAPKMPLINTTISKMTRMKMHSTAARFWNDNKNDL